MSNKIKLATIIIFTCPIVLSPYRAEASEITVSGNGAETVNEAAVSIDSSANISQNNDAQISNNSTNNSDTGGNSAVNNIGDSSVSTGDAGQNAAINNNINSSALNQDCCPDGQTTTNINISDNGAGSRSDAGVRSSDTQVISTSNQADITNNINNEASTGNNFINSNNGTANIRTGNIYSNITANNEGVNGSYIDIKTDSNRYENVKINGNGALAQVNVKLDNKTKSIIKGENKSIIHNNITSDLTSGDNKIAKNTGLASILTGNIFSNININNALNRNILSFDCCIKKAEAYEGAPVKENKSEDKPSQQPAAAPSTSGAAASITSGNSSSSGSSGPGTSSGEVAGITAKHLPVTGNNWLFFSLLGNIIMLFLGAYLRLRSGNSPPVYAYA